MRRVTRGTPLPCPGLLASLVLVTACQLPPVDTGDVVLEPPVLAPTDEAPHDMLGFSWVVPDQLAAMPRPGRLGDESLTDDLEFLAARDIDLLLSLTVVPIDPDRIRSHGLTPMHLPVRDFTAPTMDQLVQFIDAATVRLAQGHRVGVHCTAGRGRTGTFMAAYFVHTGMEPDAAIAEIRRLRPGSIETAEQEVAIHEFAALLAGQEPAGP